MNTWLCAAVLIACFLFGGGSRIGFLGDFVIQLAALPLLLLSFSRWISNREYLVLLQQSSGKLLIVSVAFFAAVILVQLLPLPAVWFASRFSSIATEAALPISFSQLSLTPAATWAVALSCIAPLAVFAGVSQLDENQRFSLVWLVLGFGAFSLLVGFLQVVGGTQSYLRFFEITNPTEAVGFFANRNHFAAQLYATLIFASLWFVFTANTLVKPSSLGSQTFLQFAAAAALVIALIAGLAIARSRAGIFLSMAAIIGIAAMFATSGKATLQHYASHNRRFLIVVLGLALVFAMQFGLHRVLSRFETDPLDDLRTALTPTTLKLAITNLPFGTGLGSFVPIYAEAENTGNLFTGYANRAHNDWAEFLLEAGALGIASITLFLWWFIVRTIAVWRHHTGEIIDRHQILQRGVTLIIALLLLHSLVDYPLRTTSLAALFAFACAILIQPLKNEEQSDHQEQTPSRRKHVRKRTSAKPMQAASFSESNEWATAWKAKIVRNTAKSE